MKKIILSFLFVVAFNPAFADKTAEDTNREQFRPKLTEQYVMLYYKDLSAPVDFYGKVLGLKTVMDAEWVKLYEVFPGSFIGLIKEGGAGAFHKARPDNAVMVSIVTEDIDTWYDIVKNSGKVTILKELENSDNVPIRAFLVRDPGGYTVEFFQWLNK